MTKDEGLEIADTSGLTDADWAEINKLRRVYKEGGQKALWKAMEDLAQADPVRATRAIGAFFPNALREAIKDMMAESGLTLEDVRELIRKLESPARTQ